MARTQLIIDCDPGVDDAIALFMAFASREELDILAITTVGGNVGADLTARNARIIRELAGREDVPVHAGARSPLVREPVAAGDFHGASGLGSLEIFEPKTPLAEGDSARTIVEAVMARPAGAVTLAVTGPMTNLALALKMEPALARRFGPVVVMGGARSAGGNITASAEYNIFADPHAADIVFRSGVALVVHGLDATHQVRTTPARVDAIRKLATRPARAAVQLFDFSDRIHGAEGSPLHDPCTIAWLLKPDLFTTVPANIQIETQSLLTLGHTSVEFRIDAAKANARWVTSANADGFFALMTERLSR